MIKSRSKSPRAAQAQKAVRSVRAPGTAKPPKPAKQSTRPRLDGRTGERILDAAHAVFVRRGTAGARMQEIAREAGVNSALLHYYYETKDHLAGAAFRRVAGHLLPSVIEILGSDAELEEKVARVVELELDQLSRAPYLPGYLISELTHHPERARQLVAAITGAGPGQGLAVALETVRRQIARRVGLGEMHPIEPDQFIVNLMSLCIFPFAARPMILALLGIDQGGFSAFIDRRRSELAPFVARALRP
jgi:TetR/AcrR family transcriptional regulator